MLRRKTGVKQEADQNQHQQPGADPVVFAVQPIGQLQRWDQGKAPPLVSFPQAPTYQNAVQTRSRGISHQRGARFKRI